MTSAETCPDASADAFLEGLSLTQQLKVITLASIYSAREAPIHPDMSYDYTLQALEFLCAGIRVELMKFLIEKDFHTRDQLKNAANFFIERYDQHVERLETLSEAIDPLVKE